MSGASDTIFVEVSPGETRAAFVDGDGRLAALRIERLGEESRVGAIHAGRVVRVDKATRTAFVDIGGSETGILNRVRDLREGERLAVQVSRDAWVDKQPALTRRIALTGRYGVLHPEGEGVRWPRGFGGRDRQDREAAVADLLRDGEGLAVRSNFARAEDGALAAELDRLRADWRAIAGSLEKTGKPCLLRAAPTLVERLLLDEAPAAGLVLDDRRIVADLARRAAREAPDLADRIAFHDGREPLFDAAGVEDEIERALSRRVALPRGASLVFDELEALTAVDVNMGGAGTGRSSDDAILALNRSAAAEAARQIALRNIAGLIVVDFVSMRNKRHRRDLVEAVRRAFARDRVTVDVLGMTPAGLVEVTRQRRGRSLASMMYEEAPREPGWRAEALACAALRAALRALGGGRPVLQCRPDVAAALRGRLSGALEETTRRLGQSLELREDAQCRDYEMLWERPT